jgi:hypothetical protein
MYYETFCAFNEKYVNYDVIENELNWTRERFDKVFTQVKNDPLYEKYVALTDKLKLAGDRNFKEKVYRDYKGYDPNKIFEKPSLEFLNKQIENINFNEDLNYEDYGYIILKWLNYE